MELTLLHKIAFVFFAGAGLAFTQQTAPLSAVAPIEGNFVTRNFKFTDGQSLSEMRLHYMTMGTPRRDASGRVNNAVLILGGTNRKNSVFMIPSFAGTLFNASQLLDTSKYYVILPDQLGAGQSSKPSDGLRAKFPHYDYADMVRASRLLVTEGLKVDHLRLFIGTSMGCMEGFLWAETHPDDIDAFMLLSCLPVQIASRNRMGRKLIMDDIRLDPGWNGGNYTQQPFGLRAALGHLLMVGSSPTLWQKEYSTAALADKYVDQFIEDAMKTTDANDMLYQYDASRNYDPSSDLANIRSHLVLVNAYDDFLNPGELGIAEREIKKVKNGKFVLLPVSDQTRGHYTYYQAPLWQKYLADLLDQTKR
jgi:homoserine O-acetyltransferase/O-succinyltransferase